MSKKKTRVVTSVATAGGEPNWCSKLGWLNELAKGKKPRKQKKVKNPYDITCEPKEETK